MYCPKCMIDVGNEEFCEVCGTETVDKLHNYNSESNKDNNKSFNIKKATEPKINRKNIIKFGIVAVILIALFISYSSLKSIYSADAIVEKYVDSISKGNASKAFKMLDIEESEFVNPKQFKKYIENLDIKGKETFVRTLENENKLYNDFADMQKKYSDVMPRNIKFYKAQIGDEVFSIVALKKGKKMGIFNNWLIGTEGLTKEWKIQAPKGSKVYVDGKEIKQIDNAQNFGGSNRLFAPENKIYIINNIFPNDYEITATLEGAKKIKKVGNPSDAITVLSFEATEELQSELSKQAKEFIKLYYKDADKSEFKGIVHEQFNFLNKNRNSFKLFKSKTFKEIEILGSSIDDIEHARLNIKVTFEYEQEQISNFFTGKKKLVKGNSSETFNLTFKKVGDKWKIVDTGYLY